MFTVRPSRTENSVVRSLLSDPHGRKIASVCTECPSLGTDNYIFPALFSVPQGRKITLSRNNCQPFNKLYVKWAFDTKQYLQNFLQKYVRPKLSVLKNHWFIVAKCHVFLENLVFFCFGMVLNKCYALLTVNKIILCILDHALSI